MTIRDPFVTEVIRIIKKCHPRVYGKRTIVLVSRRFYDAACEEVETLNREVWGRVSTKRDVLLVDQVLALPAPWLSDYEFEIRPPSNI